MTIIKKMMNIFTKKHSKSAPLLIIKKETDDSNVKEYESIDEAIADLENDPNVPSDKIEKLKSSLKKLKNKTSIKIRNGEIIK
jgi:septal ring factor EnvC (AmiA/AmiB activator)